ncbi:MAG: hypothetical protein EP330_16940 [Deltaproteobacteria bacterium]|nr:MAG: hypothetical protein EP330_16940 [Deltaproteobacteria bacterium]
MTQLRFVAAAALMLTGCREYPMACTTEARSSVIVFVEDSGGTPVADAEVVFTVDGGAEEACMDNDGGEFVCGFEQDGHFAITGDGWGFAPTTVEVDVDADACHVITETVTLVLEPVGCTEEEVPSVQVTVTDSQGTAITSADVAWNMADEDDLPEACESLGGNQWVCAYETAGDLRIDIDNAGPYEPYTTVVTVAEDECHVITEQLSAVLQFLPD